MSLKSAKKALRSSMAKALRDLTQSDLQSQSEAIIARVIEFPAFKRARTISCYLSMPTAEVQTTALVSSILADNGKRLFVPSLAFKEGRMDFVRLYDDDDLRLLPVGLWGIPEPTAEWGSEKRQSGMCLHRRCLVDSSIAQYRLLPVSDVSCDDLDLIIMPGVAFDSSLSRLGHGKGYYDHFISSYVGTAKRPQPLLVALSLQQQLLEAGQVPVTDHDWKVDIIVTPKYIITQGGPHD
ncbi:hypothetical protein J3R83DRAFT_5095 [Lanmaoa asiatica]|nr:hypothetical protein J3R83DRAFT_5095 [Lanmaoa asiatica]